MYDKATYRKNRDDLVRYATTLVGPAAAEDVVYRGSGTRSSGSSVLERWQDGLGW